MSALPSMVDALVRDMNRFRRAVEDAGKLHVPVDGKCRECRKPWPCPTNEALRSALNWDGCGAQQTDPTD